MAKTKAAGSTRLGRDSISKRLGMKAYDGQHVPPGAVLVRQRGTKFIAGENVVRGGDDTLYAKIGGIVRHKAVHKRMYDGRTRLATRIEIRV